MCVFVCVYVIVITIDKYNYFTIIYNGYIYPCIISFTIFIWSYYIDLILLYTFNIL